MDKIDKWVKQRIKENEKFYREQHGYNWKTDIKTYFFLMFHPKNAVNLVYDYRDYQQRDIDKILKRCHEAEKKAGS